MDAKVFGIAVGCEFPGGSNNNRVSFDFVATESNGDSSSRPAPKQAEGERAFPSGKPRIVVLYHHDYELEVGAVVYRSYLSQEIGQTPFPAATALAHITFASVSGDVSRRLEDLKRNNPSELSGTDLVVIATRQLLQACDFISYGVRLHADGIPARNGWEVVAHTHGLQVMSDEEAWSIFRGDVVSRARKARYWVSHPERFAAVGGER